MPTLKIDNRDVTVPDGTKVIDAAERLGIMIPRFCYHPALGSVGACRVCAVKVEEGTLKGIQMSCMLTAENGMVVYTDDAEAVDFRRQVIEWLMVNHPHDCPVCDEGGHCLLQDMTVSGGHGMRRFAGLKRTYPDQDLGPLVQHEMNRCIHCYRCSRFYQEVTGYRDLGVMQNANRTFFGRFEPGALESPYAGNLSDICPTGVYTDKPSRYKGRRWDYQRTKTICIHCSLGCHTTTSSRYREVVRQEARRSDTVNGWFICDRGRFGASYASADDRPREGKVDGRETTWEESLRAAAERIDRAARQQGADTIATVGSVRNSLETMAMLSRLSATKGWRPPVFWMNRESAIRAGAAVNRLEPTISVALGDIADADVLVVVGADPLNEAPMLALQMRQARRRGARIFVLDPRPIALPFGFNHLPIPPAQLMPVVGALVKAAVDPNAAPQALPGRDRYDALRAHAGSSRETDAWIDAAAGALAGSEHPVIVCGTAMGGPGLQHLAADGALWLRAMGKTAGVFYTMDGPNAAGAVLMDKSLADMASLIDDIDSGSVTTLIAVESDPLGRYPDKNRVEKALNRLDLLVVLDHVPTATGEIAHILLATATLFEAGGCFLNQEARLQSSDIALGAGTPIRITGGGDHPPRRYAAGVPGGDVKPAWQTLAMIADRDELPDSNTVRESIWKWIAGTQPPFAHIVPADGIPKEGIALTLTAVNQQRFQPTANDRPSPAPGDFDLILTEWTFGTEPLSSLSPHLRQVEAAPALAVNPVDADRLGVVDGDTVELMGLAGSVRLPVSIDNQTAVGVLVMPRHHRIDWQVFGPGPVRMPAKRIRKA
ncbi:MAG: NADH-quinone oxidoreductase subunit NuoG [Desulfobacterales bacterium]|jgi:NADH-quinone oxidoreductase subunit G